MNRMAFACGQMDISMDTHMDIPMDISMDTHMDIPMDISMDTHMDIPMDISIKSKVSKLDGSCT